MSFHDLITGGTSDTLNRSTRPSSLVRSSMVWRYLVGGQDVQRGVPGADLQTRQRERTVPPDLVHRDADVVHDLRRGQGADSVGSDRPVRVEHVHDLPGAQTLRRVGVDVDALRGPCRAGRPRVGAPASQGGTSVTTTDIEVAQRRALLASGLRVGPRNVQHNLELQK